MNIKEIIMQKKFTKKVRDILLESYELNETYGKIFHIVPLTTAYEFFYIDLEDVGYSMINNYTLGGIEELIDLAKSDPLVYEVCVIVFAYIKKNKDLNNDSFQRQLSIFLEIENNTLIECPKTQSCLIYLRTEIDKNSIRISFPLKSY